MEKSPLQILYYNYNSEHSCITLGTNKGFKVYSLNPLSENCINRGKKIYNIKIIDFEGGIKIVEILRKSNIFCLVGTGKNKDYPLNNVLIWDDKEDSIKCTLKFHSEIKNLKLINDKYKKFLLTL